MTHLLVSLLVLCFANSSSLSALVLHQNGALVPEDTAEVAAARELHLEALASVSEDGEVTASEEELILLTEEEARRLINGLNFQQRLKQLWKKNPLLRKGLANLA
jgi:hypothetical protein